MFRYGTKANGFKFINYLAILNADTIKYKLYIHEKTAFYHRNIRPDDA